LRPLCYFFSNAISISFLVFVIVVIVIVTRRNDHPLRAWDLETC